MKQNRAIIFSLFICIVLLCTCAKKDDDTAFKNFDNYLNLKKGKYIIYQLDSTVTASFGARFETHSYLIKDSIVDIVEDNLGQESYKIFRYQYDSITKAWNSVNTFLLTPQKNTVEYIENNFRYIKLINPISDAKTWKGNAYINSNLFFENDNYPNWEYFYQDVAKTKTIGGVNFLNTVTVVQYDSLSKENGFYKYGYSSYTKSYEVYADTIGLVSKDVLSWEYQPDISVYNCKMIKPKTGTTGFDTIAIDCDYCSTSGYDCDSLRRLNVRFIGDSSLNEYYYKGFGISQTIKSHN